MDSTTPAPTLTLAAVAELSDVSVTFPADEGEITALDHISLRVPSGGVLCLLGPNGAGKTTAINVLTGLVAPSGGHVQVGGFDPADDRRRSLEQVALVPQETALYERLTAQENLEFHGRFYGVAARRLRTRIDHVLEIVGLIDRREDRVETFSGGMRRRLALARALLTQARLVLLDEPTLGVDVQSRNAIWDQIRTLASTGTAVVLTTNYMDEAEQLADTVHLIDHGQTVAAGRPSELKDQLRLDVGQQLRLRFAAEREAAAAAASLAAGARTVRHEGPLVELDLDSAEAAADELGRLRSLLGATMDHLERFELHEPSLQEVFLHFTGRGLRD